MDIIQRPVLRNPKKVIYSLGLDAKHFLVKRAKRFEKHICSSQMLDSVIKRKDNTDIALDNNKIFIFE